MHTVRAVHVPNTYPILIGSLSWFEIESLGGMGHLAILTMLKRILKSYVNNSFKIFSAIHQQCWHFHIREIFSSKTADK